VAIIMKARKKIPGRQARSGTHCGDSGDKWLPHTTECTLSARGLSEVDPDGFEGDCEGMEPITSRLATAACR
jgi:hypothetical protein